MITSLILAMASTSDSPVNLPCRKSRPLAHDLGNILLAHMGSREPEDTVGDVRACLKRDHHALDHRLVSLRRGAVRICQNSGVHKVPDRRFRNRQVYDAPSLDDKLAEHCPLGEVKAPDHVGHLHAGDMPGEEINSDVEQHDHSLAQEIGYGNNQACPPVYGVGREPELDCRAELLGGKQENAAVHKEKPKHNPVEHCKLTEFLQTLCHSLIRSRGPPVVLGYIKQTVCHCAFAELQKNWPAASPEVRLLYHSRVQVYSINEKEQTYEEDYRHHQAVQA